MYLTETDKRQATKTSDFLGQDLLILLTNLAYKK